MHDVPACIAPRGRFVDGRPLRASCALRIIAFAALCAFAESTLAGCGDVSAPAADAAPPEDSAPDPCSPTPCTLLSDDFNGASLDKTLWGTATAGGATVTQTGGVLSIRLPASADAWADVFSLTSFPVGTTFEASVTFSAGQFYDHKGIGFASGRIGSRCDEGESDSVIFRGQDDDGYVQTKTASVSACSLMTDGYAAGPRTLRIARQGDQVVFRQNAMQMSTRDRVPSIPLPARFSAYTYTQAPAQPLQIDIDWVLITRP